MPDETPTSGLSRRRLIAGLAAAPALTMAATPAAAQMKSTEDEAAQARAALKDAKGTKLVILGSGAGPVPGRTRRMTSHVMVSNGAAYVVDCGLGVTNQYARTGIPFGALKSIFITHHHADHNIEYGPLLIVGWIQGMPLSVRAFGPPPLKAMTEDFLRAYKTTVDFWAEDFKMKPLVSLGEGSLRRRSGDAGRERQGVVDRRAASAGHAGARLSLRFQGSLDCLLRRYRAARRGGGHG
jgi:hypothetical protein